MIWWRRKVGDDETPIDGVGVVKTGRESFDEAASSSSLEIKERLVSYWRGGCQDTMLDLLTSIME